MPKGIYDSPNRRVPHPNKRSANPGHSAIHNFLARHYTKSGRCDHCGREGKTHWAAKDHSNYTRNIEDYMELCPKCHVEYDHRPPPSRRGATLSPEHLAAICEGRRRGAARRRQLGLPDPGGAANAARFA